MSSFSEELFKFNPWWKTTYHPDYIARPKYGGVELDFLANGMLMEVKYGSELTPEQKILFDAHKAKQKILIQNIEDYLKLEESFA